jgi:predicted nucleotidyltransferase
MILDKKTIDELMMAYVDILKAELGDNLKTVVLYGSCARGEQEIGSDIDVFILVQEANSENIKLIRSLSDKLDWQYDTLISNTIRSLDVYNKYKNDTLYRNIRQEGRVYYATA